MQAADREHIAICMSDVEVVVNRSSGVTRTPQQMSPSRLHIPMLGRGCAIELTEADADEEKIHSRAT